MASFILFSFGESTFSRIQSIALSQGCTLFNTKIMNLLLLSLIMFKPLGN